MGSRTVSHSEQVRPLLSPGDVRELPVDDELVFVTGFKPMRVKKVRYFADATFKSRLLPAPKPALALNAPAKSPMEWLRERAKGPVFPLPVRTSPSSQSSSRGAPLSGQTQALDRYEDESVDQDVAPEGFDLGKEDV